MVAVLFETVDVDRPREAVAELLVSTLLTGQTSAPMAPNNVWVPFDIDG
jgi:hypothetical protein